MRILQITPETFDAARPALAGLLLDAVANGASLGFLADINLDEANAYWRQVEDAILLGSRRLFVAERDGGIVGATQLDLCQRKNGINRAEVQKVMVRRAARGAGIGKALMKAVEEEALRLGRGVLFLDTEAGSVAEALYRSMGYTFIGGIPEYACNPDGEWRANAIYYKTLFLRNPS